MFTRFNENPAMTLQDIKKKTLRTDARTDGQTDNVKTVYISLRGYNYNLEHVFKFSSPGANINLCACWEFIYFLLSSAGFIQNKLVLIKSFWEHYQSVKWFVSR